MIFDLVKCVDHPPNQNNMFTVNVVYFSILWGYHRWAYCERRRCLTCSYSSYSGASLDFSAARTWNVVKLSNIWRITGSLSDISNHILPINISHPSIHIYYNLFSKQYNTHSNVVAFLQGFLSINPSGIDPIISTIKCCWIQIYTIAVPVLLFCKRPHFCCSHTFLGERSIV